MDIIVAIIAALLTGAILNSSKVKKTSSQIMLMGIEISIVSAVLILIVVLSSSSVEIYLAGVALLVIGFMMNIYGFNKK
jgi:uncharacterized membrane protein HdeD (DUF308 family)